jgi:hypothetical protein
MISVFKQTIDCKWQANYKNKMVHGIDYELARCCTEINLN